MTRICDTDAATRVLFNRAGANLKDSDRSSLSAAGSEARVCDPQRLRLQLDINQPIASFVGTVLRLTEPRSFSRRIAALDPSVVAERYELQRQSWISNLAWA